MPAGRTGLARLAAAIAERAALVRDHAAIDAPAEVEPDAEPVAAIAAHYDGE